MKLIKWKKLQNYIENQTKSNSIYFQKRVYENTTARVSSETKQTNKYIFQNNILAHLECYSYWNNFQGY